MLARHNWITPVLNGTPWLEKPALYYWSAMLSYLVFGISDWAARIPSAVAAAAMTFGVYGFMRRFRPGAELDAALIVASCAAMIGFARGASTDMLLAATLTMAMLAWYAWLSTTRRAWLAAFYVLLALGTLAKGPVAPLLAGLMVLAYAGARRNFGIVRRTLFSPALLVFFVVALPWYIAVQIETPQFFRVFIFEHNLARFGTNLYRHRQPFWYYFPVLLLSVLPWTAYVAAAAVAGFRRSTDDSNQLPAFPTFLLLWIAVPLVFFSFSESKLPGYLLPGIPACGLLLADWMWRRLRSGQQPGFVLNAMHSALCGMLLAVAVVAPYTLAKLHVPGRAILVAAIAALVIFMAVLLTLRSQGLRMLRFVTLAPVVIAMALVVRGSAPVIDRVQSARPVAADLTLLGTQHAAVAVFRVRRELEYGLTFYRNQPVLRYERGEVPAADHLVIAPEGSQPQVEQQVVPRRVSRVGNFAPQHLEFFWISPPMHQHMH